MTQYRITTGSYETGTPEQQAGYKQLFGEDDTKAKFDLYFHWFNILHEIGHCLIDINEIEMSPVDEELFVNCFAVQYWKLADCSGRLSRFQALIDAVFCNLPRLLPDDMDFATYFSGIWGTEQMNNVQMYGYFQMCCVEQALKDKRSLGDLLKPIGMDIADGVALESCCLDDALLPISVLQAALNNMRALGCKNLDIVIEQTSNPEMQFCNKI